MKAAPLRRRSLPSFRDDESGEPEAHRDVLRRRRKCSPANAEWYILIQPNHYLGLTAGDHGAAV